MAPPKYAPVPGNVAKTAGGEEHKICFFGLRRTFTLVCAGFRATCELLNRGGVLEDVLRTHFQVLDLGAEDCVLDFNSASRCEMLVCCFV